MEATELRKWKFRTQAMNEVFPDINSRDEEEVEEEKVKVFFAISFFVLSLIDLTNSFSFEFSLSPGALEGSSISFELL